MKALDELASIDRTNRAGEFASLVKHLGRARGDFRVASAMAEDGRAPQRVRDVLKAAISAGGLGWGTETVGFQQLVSGFQDALRHTSLFYRLLGDGAIVRLPFQTRVGAIGTAAGASIVEPGAAIPLSTMALANVMLGRSKAAGMLVLSQELLDGGGSAAEALISRSLRASVSQAVDAEFVSILLTDETPNTATASALTDLGTLLTAVGLTEESRPYWFAAPDVAIRASTLEAVATGNRLFPDSTPVGGMMLGVPVLVSSTVPAATLVLVDAARLAGAADTIEIAASMHASLQMDDAPAMHAGTGDPVEPVPTQATSMFQTNSVALAAIAYFAAEKVRAGSVSTLDAVAW